MAIRNCRTCLSPTQANSYVSLNCKGETIDTGLTGFDAFNINMVDFSDGNFCNNCAFRVNQIHCPREQGGRPSVGQEPIGGLMRSATGEKGICGSDKQLTLHSLSIGIGAVAGLALFPNKLMGAVGGMVAGGVLGGLILNSACK